MYSTLNSLKPDQILQDWIEDAGWRGIASVSATTKKEILNWAGTAPGFREALQPWPPTFLFVGMVLKDQENIANDECLALAAEIS